MKNIYVNFRVQIKSIPRISMTSIRLGSACAGKYNLGTSLTTVLAQVFVGNHWVAIFCNATPPSSFCCK